MKHHQQIKDLLARNRLDMALPLLSLLLEKNDDAHLENKAIQLKALYASTQHLYTTGQMTPQEREAQLMRVRQAVLDILEEGEIMGYWGKQRKFSKSKLLLYVSILAIVPIFLCVKSAFQIEHGAPIKQDSLLLPKHHDKQTRPLTAQPKKTDPAPPKMVDVSIILNSYLKDSSVFIDGRKTPLTNNGMNIKKVRVSAGRSHEFKVGTSKKYVAIPLNPKEPIKITLE